MKLGLSKFDLGQSQMNYDLKQKKVGIKNNIGKRKKNNFFSMV
jgi:hypothetical protein